MQHQGDIQRVERTTLLLLLLFASALMAVGADAATPVRGAITTTSPFSNPNVLTTATTAPVCQAPCECLSTADAQARWGEGGYTQCSQAPCYQYSTEVGSIKFYCYQQKKVTTAAVRNIPPVTTTLIPVIRNVPAVPTTTPSKIITPDPCSIQGKVNCGGTCVDIKSDPANCGQCGGKCPGKADTCFAGFCQAGCAAGQTECNYGYCVDLLTNSDHCGACGNNCPAGSVCCKGTCRDLKNDAQNCGQCNHICLSGAACCNGKCNRLTTDAANCGACGHSCSDPASACCNSKCTNLKTSAANCGACGNQCPDSAPACCNGACTNLTTDTANCGLCGMACNSGDACIPYAGTGLCQHDMDHDGVYDIFDNCPTRYNPEQWAMPGSKWGDACRCLIYPDALGGGDLDRDCQQDDFIPLRLSGGAEKVDIVFLPDCFTMSYVERNQFHDMVVNLIRNGWEDTDLNFEGVTQGHIKDYNNKVNFYLSYSCVETLDEQIGTGNYADFEEYYAFADAVGILISDPKFRGWAGTRQGVSVFAIRYADNGTFMHELGHAFFRLGDEYCCDTSYATKPNTFRFLSECKARADAIGVLQSHCTLYCDPSRTDVKTNHCYPSFNWDTGESSPGLYKLDLNNCLMNTGDQGNAPYFYDSACSRFVSKKLALVP